MAKTLEMAGSELPGRSAVHRPLSGTLQWRKVAHRLLVVLVCAILLLDLGLLGMHVAGYRLFPTLGDSMEPASSAGWLLIARLTAPEDIRSSDFIVFSESSPTLPFTAHRVDVVLTDGERAIAVTKGDNNPGFDPEPVTLDGPVARVVLAIPRVGWFVTPETAWRLWVMSALLGLTIALRRLAERRTTTALAAELRSDRWTRWLAEKRIRMTLPLKTGMRSA